MNLKKTILVVGGVALLGTPLFLTAVGLADFPKRLKPENVTPLNEWLGKNNAKLPSEGCDQSATTTPCGSLPTKFEPAPVTQQPSQTTNASLDHAYVVKGTRLSMKYPDGYEIVDTTDIDGKIMLRDAHLASIGASKVPALIITPSSAQAFNSAYTKTHIFASLKDFEVTEIRGVDHPEMKGVYEKEITKNNVISRLPSGLDVLSQTYESRWFDQSGVDVTDKACLDGCYPIQRYILFKSATDSAVIASLGMDKILEKKIIESIEYK